MNKKNWFKKSNKKYKKNQKLFKIFNQKFKNQMNQVNLKRKNSDSSKISTLNQSESFNFSSKNLLQILQMAQNSLLLGIKNNCIVGDSE